MFFYDLEGLGEAWWAAVYGVTESDATETEQQQQNAEGSDSQSDGSLDLP